MLQTVFPELKIPHLPFADDNAEGSKVLKRSSRSIQDLIEAFASLTFPATERLVAARIFRAALESYLRRLGQPEAIDKNDTPSVYRDLIETFTTTSGSGFPYYKSKIEVMFF